MLAHDGSIAKSADWTLAVGRLRVQEFIFWIKLAEESMRPLCGAIIVAGAMIGLGLTAIGFGTRYHTGLENVDKDGNPILLHLYQMDKPLVLILVLMTATAVIGLGITFVGLAYHHHKRNHELLHLHGRFVERQRPTG